MLDEPLALGLGASPCRSGSSGRTRGRGPGTTAGRRGPGGEGMHQRRPTRRGGCRGPGYARLGSDPKGACGLRPGVRLNPRSLIALQNKAHVLSKLGRDRDAIAALDEVVDVYPDFVQAPRRPRVLVARIKQRSAAHDDAEECLTRDKNPLTAYQLAGVYALTSRDEPADRKEAFRLLSSAPCAGGRVRPAGIGQGSRPDPRQPRVQEASRGRPGDPGGPRGTGRQAA